MKNTSTEYKIFLYREITCSRLFILFWLFSFSSAHAQVSFRNPLFPSGFGNASEFSVYNSPVDAPNYAVNVPGLGDGIITANFTATLFRPTGTSTAGSIGVFLGKSQTNLASFELTTERPQVDNSLWVPAIDANGNPSNTYEQLTVTQTFSASADIVGDNTGFYAVYYDNNNALIEISHPVLLNIQPSNPPSSSSGSSLDTYYPCAGTEICGDQCVPYGTVPSPIKGRVRAAKGGWYNAYYALCNSLGIPTWATDNEYETIFWQYSYDNVNWTEIPNYQTDGFSGIHDGAWYQPKALTRTTYYRRRSTHRVSSWWRGDYTDDWYISNTVKLTPSAPVPQAAQPSYTSCGNIVSVSVTANPNTTSYNWSVPYEGWTISDGTQSPFSTYYSNQKFVTNRNSGLQIYPASNATPGDYIIYFSASGNCGNASNDASLTVTIKSGGTTDSPSYGYFSQANGATYCYPSNDLYAAPVAGATSYTATLNDGTVSQGYFDPNTGTVVFRLGIVGPRYGVSAQIIAFGDCGASPPYLVNPTYLNGPPNGCGPIGNPEYEDYFKAYPNPVTNSLSLEAKGDSATCLIYDDKGILAKTILLEKAGRSKAIDVSGLPSGLYNIVIQSPGRKSNYKHLVIQH